MIRKLKKLITCLLTVLSIISIFPTTNAFAITKEEKEEHQKEQAFLLDCTYDENTQLYKKDGKYYKTRSNGDYAVMVKNIFFADYYGQADGSLVSNKWIYAKDLKSEENHWRYFGSDYKCVTDYKKIDGKTYYFWGNGDLKIGWWEHNGWYYSKPDGSIQEGWLQYDGNWYYICANGAMAKNTTIEGYYLNNKGICV